MLGLTRKHMFAFNFNLDATLNMSSSSSSDSILNCRILFLSAISISEFSLPTPEKIIF